MAGLRSCFVAGVSCTVWDRVFCSSLSAGGWWAAPCVCSVGDGLGFSDTRGCVGKTPLPGWPHRLHPLQRCRLFNPCLATASSASWLKPAANRCSVQGISRLSVFFHASGHCRQGDVGLGNGGAVAHPCGLPRKRRFLTARLGQLVVGTGRE